MRALTSKLQLNSKELTHLNHIIISSKVKLHNEVILQLLVF